MQPGTLITLDMVGRQDVLRISGLERFAGAVYHSTSKLYDWVDVVLDGGPGEEALEFALLGGGERWYVVYFTTKLSTDDIGLRRGARLPNAITFKGEEYTLQSDGQTTTARVDRKEQELEAHFADYIHAAKHIGVTIYDVEDAVFAGDAEVWYGEEISIDDVELLPIDTDRQRRGLLTDTVYRPLLTDASHHWWEGRKKE